MIYTYTTKTTSEDTGREEQREAPLQLVALIIHADEVDTATKLRSG